MESDRHQLGLFSRQGWLCLIEETDFQASAVPCEYSAAKLGIEPLSDLIQMVARFSP